MDIGTLRGLLTGILLLAFVGLIVWLVFFTRKTDFEHAARMPLEEDRKAPESGARLMGS
ncbi:MAG: CcoQ/FixQ family Cbb3-type cytochrome c oxidase assembly chaperone [Pseudomonadota bacterium]